MNRVIITGPTGAIGMALIQYLSERNIQVIAVVRGDSARKDRIKESDNVAMAECALSELLELPQRVKEVIKRKCWDENQLIDVFYHFAWDGTFGDSRNDMFLQNKNVEYTLNAVNLAHRLGCKTFIGAGSQAEYGRVEEQKLTPQTPAFPENGYGIAKLCAGQMSRIMAQAYGIKHIWFRILSVYGPYDGEQTMIMSGIVKMLEGESPEYTPAGQIWDYLYSEDAAKALFLAAEKGKDGAIYCLGSGSAKPLKEYIDMMRDQINPQIELKFGARPYAKKQVMYLCADISNLQEDTGFTPEYTFEEGIRKTIAWYRGKAKEEHGNKIY